MDAIRSTLRILFLAITLSFNAACFAYGVQPGANLQGLERSDKCAQTVKHDILHSLKSPPKFDGLKSAVHWTRTHLGQNLQGALGNAAQDTLLISGFKLSHLSKSPKLIYRVLEATTSRNLWALGPIKLNICSGLPISRGRNLLLQNAIWIFLVSNKESVVTSRLQKIVGENIGFESRIFVLMMTLDATGEEWNPSWLSQAKEAQAELSRKLNERVNRRRKNNW